MKNPIDYITEQRITTPRGTFRLTTLTVEEMTAAGYGYHHSSDDGRYHIMAANNTAYALDTQAATELEASKEDTQIAPIESLILAVQAEKRTSAWDRGVKEYALDLLDEVTTYPPTKEDLLNGASNWNEYSDGGCALIYDSDIAERLCTPSELKRNHNGERQPNSREDWLDVQARALYQASRLIMRTVMRCNNG